MPFKSKKQMKACFAQNKPGWNCKEWVKHTPDIKSLPEHLKQHIGKKK